MNHSFDTMVAEAYGVEAAILLENIQLSIQKNLTDPDSFRDGRTWTHNSVTEWLEIFPYMTRGVIRGAIDKLVEANVLIKGEYSENPWDRTVWYAFKNQDMWIKKHVNRLKAEVKSIQLKPKKVKAKMSAEDSVIYKAAVDHWAKAYPEQMVGFGPLQGKSMKGILSQIVKTCLASNMEPTEAVVIATFQKLVNSLPEWYKGKDLSILNSKYGTIVYEIKNGRKKDSFHSQNSAERLFGNR